MNPIVAERSLAIAADHPAFDGHFPSRPVLPGVALLAEVLEAAHDDAQLAACVGAAPRLTVVKFLAPVEPGAALTIVYRLGVRALEWQVRAGERDVASGQIARADIVAADMAAVHGQGADAPAAPQP